MTPDEIRNERRTVARMTDEELQRAYNLGAAHCSNEAWQILEEEVNRRERRLGLDANSSSTSATVTWQRTLLVTIVVVVALLAAFLVFLLFALNSGAGIPF